MTEPKALFSVEVLRKAHGRDRFDCGVDDLNRYIRAVARQDMDRGAAVIYVAVPSGRPTAIAGYYSLSSTGVRLEDLPETTRRRLPRYPLVPATLLGRLAVDRGFQGTGLGERLLVDALGRALAASRTVASAAVVVDAKDDGSAAFYARYGFMAFRDQRHRLFITMETVGQLGPPSR